MADSASYRAVCRRVFRTATETAAACDIGPARELVADPFLIPDFQTTDGAGREIAHVLVDGFIFDFWVDHVVKQVVITEIDFVD